MDEPMVHPGRGMPFSPQEEQSPHIPTTQADLDMSSRVTAGTEEQTCIVGAHLRAIPRTGKSVAADSEDSGEGQGGL